MTALGAVLFDFSDTLFRLEQGPDAVLATVRHLGGAMDAAEAAAVHARIADGFAAHAETDAARERDRSADAHRSYFTALYDAAGVGVDGFPAALYERMVAPEAWQPYADTRQTLEALRVRRVPVAVVSDIGWDIRGAFAAHDLLGLVDAWALSFEVGAVKPDGAMFRAPCGDLGVPPEEALMIGDNPVRDGGAAAYGLAAYILPGGGAAARRERGLDAVVALVDAARRT